MATATMAAFDEIVEARERKRHKGRSSGAASKHPSPPEARAAPAPAVAAFDPEVDAFLDRYPFVVLLLKESVEPLRAHFGETAILSVTVENDPEVAGWEYLVIALRTTLPADQAQAQLEAFGAAWWLDALPRAQGQVLFTLEFV